VTILKAGEVDAYLAKPDPARPIALVYGPDAGLVSERAEALVRAGLDDPSDAFAVVRLAGDELASDPARLIDEAQSIPMFGGRRVIWVRAGGRSFAPALESLTAAPQHGAPRLAARIVIEAGDLKRTAPLRSLCERARTVAVLPCYIDSERDVERLIDAEMRDAGLTIAPEARAMLASLLGADRRASRGELRKLALFAHGQDRVTIDDVMATVVDSSAVALEALIDAAFAGKPRDVETHFAKAAAAGTTPGTTVGMALRHVAQLHKMRLAVEQGARVEDAVGPQVFFRRKPVFEAALRSWTGERLLGVMMDLSGCALRIRQQPALEAMLARHCLMRIALSGRERAPAQSRSRS
jgi:DNA polymerase-3 subunit delta